MKNIYRATMKQCVLSAIYTFGGLHLLLVPTWVYTMVGIGAICLCPVIGLLHGLLMSSVVKMMCWDSKKLETRRRVGYYGIFYVAGIVVYIGGILVNLLLLAIFHSDSRHYHTLYDLITSVPPLYVIAAGIAGSITGIRLCDWAYKNTAS